jgi:diguanylate cyclase (GGDEF)-like protein
MDKISDIRIIELKLLRHIYDGLWRDGVVFTQDGPQVKALGISGHIYADLVLTMIEDGYLNTDSSEIRKGMLEFAQYRDIGSRNNTLTGMLCRNVYHPIRITYRGIRRIEELRDELKRDRILEKFGILLDGRYIITDLMQALDQARGEPVSLLFADVDDFKRFNTDFGSQAGDEVLRSIFTTFRDQIGDRGEVYRRGGEEIVSILPYCALDRAAELAELIRRLVSGSAIRFKEDSLKASVSIGVAASPPSVADAPILEANAEDQMKRAKANGKNQTVWQTNS